MAHLSLSLLGPFQATLDGEPIAGLNLSKERALLAYLAVEMSQRDEPCPRTVLAGLLWPEHPERAALASLRNALASLRKAIGDRDATPPFLQITREAIQFDPTSDYWLDVAAFWTLVEARDAAHLAHERLEEAIALYRGDFLGGFSVPDSPEFEDWMLLMRERLQRQVLDALRRLTVHYEGSGQVRRACNAAWRWVELAPWEEEAHRALMRLLALSGQRGAALAQYEACRQALAEELGVEPGPETVALYERIHSGLETPAAPSSLSHSLPAQLTSFVGRERLLAEIEARLRDPGCRLLTLVGLGGSGKTRLALEAAARQVGRFADGVYFCALAPLRSAAAIVPAVAQAIGFSFYGREEPKEQLLRYLSTKQMLLVLDNYEHLLEGAALVPEMLRRALGLVTLVTSRSGLQVQGEHRFAVTGMSYPALTPGPPHRAGSESKEALGYSAVQLFVERARRTQGGFALADEDVADVVRICRMVDGMPLAILLAAAWAEMLTPAEIAAEIEGQMTGSGLDFLASDLRDAPERHASMRAVFDHSWTLLDERERAVMQALSVFRGGFTRAAAEEVAGASLRALMALVKRSLLRRAGGRYEIHELLRQYAAEKLAQSPDADRAARDRHAAYYAAALRGWAADLKGSRQLVAIEEMRADVDNARVAWDWAVERDHVDWLDRALEGLCLFYEWDSHLQEGEAACRRVAERLAESALNSADEGTFDDGGVSANRLRVLARVLAWQGRFSFTLGRSDAVDRCYGRALAALDRAESIYPACDVRRERALTLVQMSRSSAYTDLNRSRQLAKRSLEIYRSLDDRRGTADALLALGAALWRQADFGGARRQLEDSLSLLRTLGDSRGTMGPLVWLSWVLGQLGQFEGAERVAQETVSIARTVGDRGLVLGANANLCYVLRYTGRFAETRLTREEDLAFQRERGDRIMEGWAWLDLGVEAMHMGSYEEARPAARSALTASEAAGDWEVAAGSHMALGCLALAAGAYGEAREWLQQSIAIYEQVGGMYWIMGEALAALAYAARGLGQPVHARGHLGKVLRLLVDTRNFVTALHALPAAALLQMDAGETERAVELYALASRYPFVANSRWFEDIAGREIAAAAASALPPEVIAAAEERGRARDLWATVEELLAELDADVA